VYLSIVAKVESRHFSAFHSRSTQHQPD